MKLFSTDLKNYINYDRLISIELSEIPTIVNYIDSIPYIITPDYITNLKNGDSYYNKSISSELRELTLSFIDSYVSLEFVNLRNHLFEHINHCYNNKGLFLLFDDSIFNGGRKYFLQYIDDEGIDSKDIEQDLLILKIISSNKNNEVAEDINTIHVHFDTNTYEIIVPKNIVNIIDWFHRKYIFDYSFKSNLKI